MHMPVVVAMVVAVVVINLYGHDIDLTVAHAALGNNGIR